MNEYARQRCSYDVLKIWYTPKEEKSFSGTLYNVPKGKWPGTTNAMRYWLGRKYERDDVSVIIVDFIAQRESEEKYIMGWEWLEKEPTSNFRVL